jgi:RNA polymerase sigma factor (sigma-70 family)
MTNDEVINKYKGLVYSVAISMSKKHIFEDLLQEGFIALCNANKCYKKNTINKYKKETSFMTYAKKSIHNKMLSYIAANEYTISRPNHVFDSIKRKTHRGILLKYVSNITQLNNEIISKSNIAKEYEKLNESGYLMLFVNKLPKRYRYIITKRFGLNNSNYNKITDIATLQHVSKQAIDQNKDVALKLLKEMLIIDGYEI